jgi:hypothetical protein
MTALSIILAVVVVAVLAAALIEVRTRAINAQFDIILSALPGIGAKAAIVAERRPR